MSDVTSTPDTESVEEEPKNDQKSPTPFRWWPHYIVIVAVVMVVVTVAIAFLANSYPVPDDAPNEIPFPDEGENIPGPEWIFLLLWSPFWYCVGSAKKYLFLMPLIPLALGAFFFFLPFLHKIPFGKIPGLGAFMDKTRKRPSGMIKSLIYAIPTLVFGLAISIGTYQSGHQAKVLGCDSCHNRAMGPRMAVPPADVARYYQVERAMQIGVGKYRAGKSSGVDDKGNQVYQDVGEEEGGYKNANWQMRHMYEPTFTW